MCEKKHEARTKYTQAYLKISVSTVRSWYEAMTILTGVMSVLKWLEHESNINSSSPPCAEQEHVELYRHAPPYAFMTLGLNKGTLLPVTDHFKVLYQILFQQQSEILICLLFLAMSSLDRLMALR